MSAINFELEDNSYNTIKSQTDQIRYEFTNEDTIVLRKSGAYHKAMGNSAVMMKIVGGKTRIRSCFDSTVKQEVFEMSVHMGKIVETKKFLIGLAKEVLRDDGDVFVIRLAKPMGAKQLKKAKRNMRLKAEVAEDILMRRRSNTPTAKELRVVFDEAGSLVKTMRGTDGLVLGKMILESLVNLNIEVGLMMRDNNYPQEGRVLLDMKIDSLQLLLVMVPNFELQAVRLARIGRSLLRIRMAIMGLTEEEKAARAAKDKKKLDESEGEVGVCV